LVQNTNWRNAELAIINLQDAHSLAEETIAGQPLEELQELIRPAGFFTQKAATLHRLASAMLAAGGLRALLDLPTEEARLRLLSVKGIGFETADSILLYAGAHEVFVVDVYLRRWLDRVGEPEAARAQYGDLRRMMEEVVSRNHQSLEAIPRGSVPARHTVTPMAAMKRSAIAHLYAELHALFVADGIANKKPARERRI
jgi:endonuclease-3 related protein